MRCSYMDYGSFIFMKLCHFCFFFGGGGGCSCREDIKPRFVLEKKGLFNKLLSVTLWQRLRTNWSCKFLRPFLVRMIIGPTRFIIFFLFNFCDYLVDIYVSPQYKHWLWFCLHYPRIWHQKARASGIIIVHTVRMFSVRYSHLLLNCVSYNNNSAD